MAIVHAERHAAHNVFGAASHATLLSVGAVVENLDAALKANGLPAAWRWGDATGQPYAAVPIAGMPERFTAPEGALQRHTNRLPFLPRALEPAVLSTLETLREGGNRLILLQDGARRARLAQLVRVCSEARFCNQRLHEWLIGSLRDTPEEVALGDGLDVRTLGLPPGGRHMLRFIADWRRLAKLNNLGAYKFLARTEVGLLSAASGLLCVYGPGGPRDVIDAGRLLTRAWTALNQQGVAVHPYYVVSDQINRLHDGTLAAGFESSIGEAERDMRALLGLDSEQVLHMVLRIGYPKAQAVRSRRLPLATVFEEVAAS